MRSGVNVRIVKRCVSMGFIDLLVSLLVRENIDFWMMMYVSIYVSVKSNKILLTDIMLLLLFKFDKYITYLFIKY